MAPPGDRASLRPKAPVRWPTRVARTLALSAAATLVFVGVLSALVLWSI